MSRELWVNLTAFALTALATVLVGFFSNRLGWDLPAEVQALVVAIGILILALIIFRRRWKRSIFRWGQRVLILCSGGLLGLEKIYGSFDEAHSDILHHFRTAQTVDVFIQLGLGVIGGNRSLLFEEARTRTGRGFSMRLLYAARDSPFLSHKKASDRGSNRTEWLTSIQATEGSVRALKEEHVMVEGRSHGEPYLWRLFIFDHTLFIQPYLYDTKNSARAPVYRFGSSRDEDAGSLVRVFRDYFNFVWKKSEGLPPERPEESVPRDVYELAR